MHHDPVERVASWLEPEPITLPALTPAAFKAKWDALNIDIPPCRVCGCSEQAQSHCDRWDCPRLLPDRSGAAL